MEGTYGIISIIPTLILVIMAIKTKKLLESMLIATLVGFIILYKTDFFLNWVDTLYVVFASDMYVWIVIVTGLFGGFAKLLENSGGALGFGSFAKKYANTQKKSLFTTYILGLLVFMDDYLNALAVTAAMRNLTDEHKVPREMLAYTVNTTGSPICVLLPFSTWAVFYIGLIGSFGITYNGTAVGAYLKSIPFMFYPMIAIVVTGLLITGVIPRVGPMKKAWERVEKTGSVFPVSSLEEQDEFASAASSMEKEPKLRNFAIPLIALVIAAVLSGNDLVIATLVSIATCFVLYIGSKNMTIDEFVNSFIDGVKDLIYLFIMILLLFVLLEANNGLGFAEFVINAVKPLMTASMLPAVTFVTIAVIAFCIGSFWELSAIAMPIVLPLAEYFATNVFVVLGAIVAGAVFGNHACFFSDAMILTSTSAQIKPMDEALAGIPYAIFSAILATIGYVILGFML